VFSYATTVIGTTCSKINGQRILLLNKNGINVCEAVDIRLLHTNGTAGKDKSKKASRSGIFSNGRQFDIN
jgi:hypothetical protein